MVWVSDSLCHDACRPADRKLRIGERGDEGNRKSEIFTYNLEETPFGIDTALHDAE